jgi:hypothetical protein
MSSAVIEDLARRIVPSADIVNYITAGKATFTLRSVQTQKRYTYKVSAMKDRTDPKKKVKGYFFVALMIGPDNDNHFTYLGMIRNGVFSHTIRSRIQVTAESFKAFDFVWRWLHTKPELHPQIEFWHSGRCGHCGKKLTVPESIALGIGPICAGK